MLDNIKNNIIITCEEEKTMKVWVVYDVNWHKGFYPWLYLPTTFTHLCNHQSEKYNLQNQTNTLGNI